MTTIDLPSFEYNKENISSESINAFNLSTRDNNDKNNKTRENIIGAIINKKVPDIYYQDTKWNDLKQAINNYLSEITNKPYVNIECIHKAGRGHNYDFVFKALYEDGLLAEYNVELKFNASSIDQTPLFVSPMKPSQYMNNSYEEGFYDNCVPKLSANAVLEIPTKEEYLKQIHNNEPDCMSKYQEIYYKGAKNSSRYTGEEKCVEFYKLANELYKTYTADFINNTELNIELLSSYLYNSQKNKIYMLYHDNKFNLQQINMDDYIIISVNKNPKKCRYECTSKTGKKISVLLRWKNGNGIAFPAFQIS